MVILQRFILVLLALCNAPAVHTVSWFSSQKIDTSAVAASALGILGLGSLWWIKTREQQQPAQKVRRIPDEAKQDMAFFRATLAAGVTDDAYLMTLEKILKKRTIDLNKRDTNGSLPLVDAARTNNVKIARLLLHYGAKLNARDAHCNTALMQAEKSNHTEMVKFLEEYQNDLDAQFKKALQEKNRKQILALAPEIDSNMLMNNQGETALFEAARSNDTDMAELLLQLGIDPALQNKSGRTALISAILKRNPEMVTLLSRAMSYQAINEPDKDSNTAIIYAADTNNTTMVVDLLAAGADPCLQNKDGITAADITHNYEIKKLLNEHIRLRTGSSPTNSSASSCSSPWSKVPSRSSSSSSEPEDFARKYNAEYIRQHLAQQERAPYPPLSITGPSEWLPSR